MRRFLLLLAVGCKQALAGQLVMKVTARSKRELQLNWLAKCKMHAFLKSMIKHSAETEAVGR